MVDDPRCMGRGSLAEQARTDFAAIESNLEFIMEAVGAKLRHWGGELFALSTGSPGSGG
jgi:hypothetical protein